MVNVAVKNMFSACRFLYRIIIELWEMHFFYSGGELSCEPLPRLYYALDCNQQISNEPQPSLSIVLHEWKYKLFNATFQAYMKPIWWSKGIFWVVREKVIEENWKTSTSFLQYIYTFYYWCLLRFYTSMLHLCPWMLFITLR